MSRRIETYTVTIAAAGACYIVAGLALGFRPFDDTFITFRYARNLAAGSGFVYNAGERVLGTTSPAWALVLAAASRLGAPIATAAVTLSLFADVLTAWLIARLLSRFGASALVAGIGGLLFLGTFDALSLARSGMETSAFTAALFGALASAAYDRPAIAGGLAALAALIRPEGLVVVPIVIAAAALRRNAIITAAAAAAILLPWVAFASWYFGSPIPQSLLAKAATARAGGLAHYNWINVRLFLVKGQYGRGIFERSYWSLTAVRTVLALAGIVAALKAGRRAALLLAAFPVGVFSALALANAFTWFSWYYEVFYAGFALLAGYGLHRVADARPWGRRLSVGIISAFVAAQITVALALKLPGDRNFVVRNYLGAASVVDARAQTRIAALEIGAIGWAAWPAAVVDLEGLVTPSSLGRPADAIIRETMPDYIVWRTRNAASTIDALSRDGWLSSHYDRVVVIEDPAAPQRFETYRRRPVSRP